MGSFGARSRRNAGWLLMLAAAGGAVAIVILAFEGQRGGTPGPAAGGPGAASVTPATAAGGGGLLGSPPPPLVLRPRLLRGSVLGVLRVPGLPAPIDVVEGLVEGANGIGHDDTTAYPGEPHPMVLEAGARVAVPALDPGAALELTATYGAFEYRVTSEGPAPASPAAGDAPELRLVAGPPTLRRMVTATLVPGDPATAAEVAEEVAVAQAQARALSSGLVGKDAPQRLLVPCRGPVTQGFGPTPYTFELPFVDGGVYYAHFHTGIDIAVPAGTPIRAAAEGTVVLATTNIAGGVPVGYGTYVLIAHGGGEYTLYGHLSSLGVRAGQRVAAGQVIGLAGTTGNSTGPHLHFEVRYGTRPVDPLPLLG